jgi:hypothetical protein
MREYEQALRAARSLARNRELMPKVEERLAKAESMLESYLLRSGQTAARVGGYVIELRDGVLRIGPASPDGWEQGEIEWKEPPRFRADHQKKAP